MSTNFSAHLRRANLHAEELPIRPDSLRESHPEPMRASLRSALTHALVALLGVAAAAGAGEILVRLYMRTHTLYDVEMTHYALRLKTDSPNPLIGHVHAPNRSATLMNVPVRINADGLRDVDHSIPKGDRYRIIFLGDSFTFGWGVTEAETFKSLLEAALNQRYPTEIINFGTGNYNSEQEVNLFLEKGLKYTPDKVVVFYFINDAEPTWRRSALPFLYHSDFITLSMSRLHALAFDLDDGSGGYRGYYTNLYRAEAPGWQRARAALLRLKEVCAEHGIELQVVLIPELHQLQDYPFATQHQLVTDFLRSNDIAVLDLAPLFTDQTDPKRLWVAEDDAHANALGHKLIAERSVEFIAKRTAHGERDGAPAAP
jgi:lysophospholipase L1-like esterase